jgi:hypothetical protein
MKQWPSAPNSPSTRVKSLWSAYFDNRQSCPIHYTSATTSGPKGVKLGENRGDSRQKFGYKKSFALDKASQSATKSHQKATIFHAITTIYPGRLATRTEIRYISYLFSGFFRAFFLFLVQSLNFCLYINFPLLSRHFLSAFFLLLYFTSP